MSIQANAEGPEVVLAEADALAAQEGKAAEAGALYKKVGTTSTRRLSSGGWPVA